MSSVTLVYVYCDSSVCKGEEPSNVAPPPHWGLEDVREQAQKNGWYCNEVDDVDICPECKAEYFKNKPRPDYQLPKRKKKT